MPLTPISIVVESQARWTWSLLRSILISILAFKYLLIFHSPNPFLVLGMYNEPSIFTFSLSRISSTLVFHIGYLLDVDDKTFRFFFRVHSIWIGRFNQSKYIMSCVLLSLDGLIPCKGKDAITQRGWR